MGADYLPQEADRVRMVECFERLDPCANGRSKRRTGRLAEAVDGEDGRAIEA